MIKFSAIALFVFSCAVFPFTTLAQESDSLEIKALNQIIPGLPEGQVEFDMASSTAHYTKGIFVRNGDTILTADSASISMQTGEAVADGHVRIEQGDQLWVGEHIRYNFKTRQMQSEQFRTGKSPVFAAGEGLTGDATTNQTYTARHVFVTTDDVADPAIRVRASRVKIVPGKYIEMWNAVLFLGDVPSFYFPYYRRNLGEHANNLNLAGGYRTAYGAFLLTGYSWYLNDEADGKFHLDYRSKRGVGLGPDLNLHLGRWGEASIKYYYLRDDAPNTGTNGLPDFGPVHENRQRFYLGYQATPYTNLNVKAFANYQSDAYVLHDFFEGDYHANPQPNTFLEVNKYWDNWSLDAESTPRLNNFFDQVERLPDVRLTGFRQQVFDTPLYYDSESSAGYYRKFFADTNGPIPAAYSATRADTYHQLLLPETFFGWLNVTPRAGGRFTYYDAFAGPGGPDNETYRKVFNTGVDVSFKPSQLWAGATNSWLAVDGLRHIIEPSVNYVYVPDPSATPSQLPQFDSELPSLQILPIEFPDYNNIDSIDSQNVLRFGLRNTLQTRRAGQIENLLDWNLLLDWRLDPNPGQQTFNDLYSAITFHPRTWIALDSQLRYDINGHNLNMAFHQLTLTPNNRWSWGIGHWYLRNGFIDGGSDFYTSTLFYRLNDNWGVRATHNFDARSGHLQEQFYSIYRDLRSWTGALTFRVTDNQNGEKDYTVAFTFSLKARPRYKTGDDTVRPYGLVGE